MLRPTALHASCTRPLLIPIPQTQPLTKKNYANGQKAHELVGARLTYFFKIGNVKAAGLFVNDNMKGKWKFYRETGQLWQVGSFTKGKKNGS